MSFFTLILILLCIYVPWIFPVIFVLLLLAYLYVSLPVLFWILVLLFIILIIWGIIESSKN